MKLAVVAVVALAACARQSSPPPPQPVSQITVEPIAQPYQPTSFVDDVHGHGRPMILIPGLGCPGAVWDDTVAHFALQGGIETHVLTLAGFAGQPAIADPINATVRAELAHYIRDRKLDHPIIIGHSLGGFIAFWLAAVEQDLLGPVIVVDALPAIGGDAQSRELAQTYANQWRVASDADFARSTSEFFSGMANNRLKLAPVIAAVARSDKRAFADAFMELFTTDIRPQLAAIRAPLLVVLADNQTLADVTAQLTDIPDRQVVVVPKTRHFVFFDDPDGFFKVVDQFLAKP